MDTAGLFKICIRVYDQTKNIEHSRVRVITITIGYEQGKSKPVSETQSICQYSKQNKKTVYAYKRLQKTATALIFTHYYTLQSRNQELSRHQYDFELN